MGLTCTSPACVIGSQTETRRVTRAPQRTPDPTPRWQHPHSSDHSATHPLAGHLQILGGEGRFVPYDPKEGRSRMRGGEREDNGVRRAGKKWETGRGRGQKPALRTPGDVTGKVQAVWVGRGSERNPWGCSLPPSKSSSQKKAPTLAILLLLSAVRKDMLLISFWTTKFCSSRLKFWRGGSVEGQRGEGERPPVDSSFSAHGEDRGTGRDSRGTWTSR